MSDDLPHLDAQGRAHMVDVGSKPVTAREATATAVIQMQAGTARRLAARDLPKGDALAVARVAGIMAAKRTSELIPLCHPIALTGVEVDIEVGDDGAVTVTARVTTDDRTGVEMEALVAATTATLTLYDMVKGVDRGARISDVRLDAKSGGASGTWTRDA